VVKKSEERKEKSRSGSGNTGPRRELSRRDDLLGEERNPAPVIRRLEAENRRNEDMDSRFGRDRRPPPKVADFFDWSVTGEEGKSFEVRAGRGVDVQRVTLIERGFRRGERTP